MDNAGIVKKVNDTYSFLKRERAPWEGEWIAAAELVSPLREDVRGQGLDSARRGTKIYDGTAVAACNLFADGLYGYCMSPAQPWFKLQCGNVSPWRDDETVTGWLEQVEACLYDALNRSNFYDAAWQFLHDGGSIGTSILYAEEDIAGSRCVFETVPIGESYIAESRYGEVDTFIRRRKMTLRNISDVIGEGNLPPDLREIAKTAPYQRIEIIHAVMPRDKRDDTKRNNTNKKFTSAWVRGQSLLRESGYDDFPYIVWRYAKSGGGTPYGRSPAMLALPEIKGIQVMAKSLLAAAQMAVEPPLNVPAEMRDKLQYRPRGINYYEDPKKIIRPIMTGTNYNIGIDQEDRRRRAIEKYFYVDFFMMLANAQGQMTATEIIERQGEKAAVLSAAVGRLNSEAMNRVIDRVFHIEFKAGRLPPPPDMLMQGGARIEIEYVGPLAQVQKRYFQTFGIRAGLEAMTPILSVRPDAADVVDWDEAARTLLKSFSFPQRALMSRDEVERIRQARTEAQRAQDSKQDVMGLLQGLKTASEADRNMGGTLAGMLEQGMEGAAGA